MRTELAVYFVPSRPKDNDFVIYKILARTIIFGLEVGLHVTVELTAILTHMY